MLRHPHFGNAAIPESIAKLLLSVKSPEKLHTGKRTTLRLHQERSPKDGPTDYSENVSQNKLLLLPHQEIARDFREGYGVPRVCQPLRNWKRSFHSQAKEAKYHDIKLCYLGIAHFRFWNYCRTRICGLLQGRLNPWLISPKREPLGVSLP